VRASKNAREGGGGECSGGMKPRKASARGPARVCGLNELGVGIEALKTAASVRSTGERAKETCATPGGQGSPEGGPIGARRRPCRVKPMDARAPSGARRSGGGVAEGVPKPRARRAARPGGRAITRVRRSGMCRRVRKAQGREHRPPRGPSGPGTVRVCCDGPLKGSASAWGAPAGAIRRGGLGWRVPGGRRNAERAGRNQ
jgi:hypothetical protein